MRLTRFSPGVVDFQGCYSNPCLSVFHWERRGLSRQCNFAGVVYLDSDV